MRDAEPISPSSSIGYGYDEGSGLGPSGWPDRKQYPAEFWGNMQFVPQPGDATRPFMFAKPIKMTEEEEKRILSNWHRMADGHGPARAMGHEHRPSTPRAVRAENRIQKLKNEGVDVDPLMEMHIRDVIESNSGIHEALRHYTQGEDSNVLIPYLNEFAKREDRMLLEWAKQRKHDYDLWEKYRLRRGSTPRESWGNAPSEDTKAPEKSSTSGDDQVREESSGEGSTPNHAIGKDLSQRSSPTEHDDKGKIRCQDKSLNLPKVPKGKDCSQGESSEYPKVSKGLVDAQNIAAARESSLEAQRMEIIRNLEAQITALDRNIGTLAGDASQTVSSPGASSSTDQDPFGRVIELLRGLLEEKQRKLCTLNKARSKAIRGQGTDGAHAPPTPSAEQEPAHQAVSRREPQQRRAGGFVGALRKVWKKCTDASSSNNSSQTGSQNGSREGSVQPGIEDRQPKTPTMAVPRPGQDLTRQEHAANDRL